MIGRKILVFSFLAMTGFAWALEPATRAEIDQYIRDGSFSWRLQNAIAFGNNLVDPGLVRDFKARLRRMAPQTADIDRGDPADAQTLPSGRKGGLPTKGTVKVFALLIDFPDYPAVNGAGVISSKLFGDGDTGWPYESLRNYYRRSSYNLLEIGGVSLGWYRAAYARDSMAQTAAAREALIKEALQYFHGQGHNFAQFDNDNNGTIDYFIVVWTGPNNGWANFWWGYYTTFSSVFSLDGKSFAGSKYSWQWESRYWPGAYDQVVVMHETGHALGLPDYYDYDATVGPGGGLGGLDMMDANRGDHNGFSKMLLDWVSPQVFNYGTGRISLTQSATTQDGLVIMPEFDPQSPWDEFFMVQNRNRAANDFYLPADGLLIWHVDARLNAQQTNFQYDNSYTAHKLLRVMEADGLEQIEKGYAANAGDYYTQGRLFGPAAAPASGRYDGTASGVTATDVSPNGPTMALTADVHYTFEPPVSFAVSRLSGDYIFFQEYVNRLNWAENPRNRTARAGYRIYKKPLRAGDEAYTLLAEIAASTNNRYDHKGLKKDEFYSYRIIAIDKNGVESAAAEAGN
jgi:M6 family metalloprotease-like protein